MWQTDTEKGRFPEIGNVFKSPFIEAVQSPFPHTAWEKGEVFCFCQKPNDNKK